jgi:probable HAF family extracellular repeat protein
MRFESGTPRRACRLMLAIALAALAAACGQALAQSAAAAATARAAYSIIPLGADQIGDAFVNARGQVAFTTQTNVVRAHFYDGRTVRDLGTLGGPDAFVTGLNEQGQVSGGAAVDPAGQTYHAYRWSRATGMVDLTPRSPDGSAAAGINDSGQVVGFGDPAAPGAGALWSPRAAPLGIPLVPTAINDAETVVGTWGDSPWEVHALAWTRAGGVRDLGATPGEDTTANAINRRGHIVGTSGSNAFLWTPRAGLIDLGSGSAGGATATRVSDGDVVVGYNRYGADCPGAHYCRGFIWTPRAGFMEIFPASPGGYTSARDVNRQGQVVGTVDGHAYLWSSGQGFVDLNTRIAGAPASLKLREGLAISDNGAIVATATTGLVLLVPRCGCAR